MAPGELAWSAHGILCEVAWAAGLGRGGDIASREVLILSRVHLEKLRFGRFAIDCDCQPGGLGRDAAIRGES
jgi:hypothetical protein